MFDLHQELTFIHNDFRYNPSYIFPQEENTENGPLLEQIPEI